MMTKHLWFFVASLVAQQIGGEFSPGSTACAQPVPPPAPAVILRSAADLDQLLAPIALYPDPLIAQILPAATQPTEVVLAARYVRSGVPLNQIDAQPWDESVKALARYPDVLKMMDDRLDWTTALGQAFYAQPADVMQSVQRLRSQALALGNLQSTPQQQVILDQQVIQIVPASPQIIYVPIYQPEVVFVQHRPPARSFLSFSIGFAIGTWLRHDCDWYGRNIIVWEPNHPRPRDWWYRPEFHRGPVVVNRNVTVNVWHPSRPVRVFDREHHDEDRGWTANVVRPAPARIFQPVVRSAVRPPMLERRGNVPPPPARPVIRESRPPSGGALVGIQSARETREYSNRGQQSREAVKPVPAARRANGAPADRKSRESDNKKH